LSIARYAEAFFVKYVTIIWLAQSKV